ncbi:translation initiation factor 3, subunit A [Tothia fuscella]|uniref:Eukaryotic translation initiation factor 3 subunit A n=1 Tax=Tothia fuscella TaxID=1048955 RepID=A0A9P4NZW5_9PEZI|nr:translation initiation factor 3, subunit A [Tothia fuscella]
MPPPHAKPENVLKRAQELIGVNQSQAALLILHESVVSKRSRNNPITTLEPVMLLFVDLCVELRKGKLAKDGLYQYKNTAQNTNVGTIELVFKKFIELAEAKVTEAQAKADAVQSTLEPTDTANIEDLEASETPESILLSTVSGEQSKDRTDRAIVTPWLKFLWETYRTVLDIFKNNARLEVMYQTTAHQAFAFCSRYARKTEFRRLCELLRNHLQNAAKFSSQMHAINLSDPDTLQRHLDTRFQQLNVAVELELWQEAFRSVEDIHTLLSLSKRPAKNIMMANYFEKLTRIFLVSENYLFHAAAWSRYYNLMRQSAAAVASGASPKKDNPAVSEADMTKAASFVLLSALAIPVISTSRSRGALVDVDERKSKNTRLTNLLGMSQAPSRAILFKDALSKGLLKRCRPEIRELYNILEVDFHPLSICKRISPILTQIGADPEMEKYVLPLQQVILTRLFQQLSQVYESVQLEFVLNLAQFPDPFKVSASSIEMFIMNGCKKGDLAIRIDHVSKVLTFDSDVFSSAKALHPGSAAGSAEAEAGSVQRLQSTPAEIVRSQLTRLAKSLYISCQYVDPSFNKERVKNKETALRRAKEGAEKEHLDTLARREIIEKKKQAASSALAQKEKDLATQKRIKAQEQQAAESQRLAEEQKERDRRRLEAEKTRVQQEEAAKALEELKRGTKGIDIDELDINNLDSGAIRMIKLRALEKEKNDLMDKNRVTARRYDHIERAIRAEEVKKLPEDYAAQSQADLEAYNAATAQTLKEAEEKHKADVELKHRLGRFVDEFKEFKNRISTERRSDFEKRRKKAEQELEKAKKERRDNYIQQKIREKKEQEEAERLEREEVERAEREAEEKAQADKERRERMEADKVKREEERKKLDAVAEKQRLREEEAEARRKKEKGAGGLVSARIPSRGVAPPSSEPAGGPPKLALAGRAPGQMSWREKEAAKKAAEAAGGSSPAENAAPPPSDAPPARRPGAFVPPALRNADGATSQWRERENSGRGRDTLRNESPANPPTGGRFVPPHLRGGAARDESPADSSDGGSRPPVPRAAAGSGGKYVPGAFRKTADK